MERAERPEPPFVADELAMAQSWLEYHRATLELKCDGLSDEQLRQRAVPPSPMSLLGLVRHMADVERNWFRRVLAGEDAPGIHYDDANPDGDFDDVDQATREEAFATWYAECERARALVAEAGSIDEVGRGRRDGQEVSLRWILLHMIEEYARHNGHADLLRERIDGAVGE
jgi:uncharacterized damage-inducible protein DinB